MHRNVIFTGLLLLTTAACSDDGESTTTGPTTIAASTLPPNATDPISGESLAPQTTFMPDCGRMPSPADLSAAVGLPIDVGLVTGPSTCEYLGLNDQSKTISLSIFSTPEEIASFNDVVAGAGTPTPLNDPAIPDAQISPDYTVFVTANNAIYVVRTRITGGELTAEVAPSAAVLARWLAL